MNKPFLLIAGWDYYPMRGTGDWIGCFTSPEEPEKIIKKVDGIWYEIIDLREWTK